MRHDFQDFQHQFAAHLRQPRLAPPPAGIPRARSALYAELVFNNLCGFLDSCFPVCRSLLGETRWRRLNRRFFQDCPLHTPWFREISREFTRYLASGQCTLALPRWLGELAHYEWIELAVDTQAVDTPVHNPQGELLTGRIIVNPTLQILRYNWPVHLIGPDYRPRKAVPTQLLVYRQADDTVGFCTVNPLTAQLIEMLRDEQQSGEQACARIAEALPHPAPQQLIAYGLSLLNELRRQGVILGSQP